MIALFENARHQVTVVGTALIAEAKSGNVDITGFTMLADPEVEIGDDGTVTLRIAIAETGSKSARKSKPKAKEAPEPEPDPEADEWPADDVI